MMDDPELQPMVQRLMRIHVTEEARHIQFARDGLRKRVADMRAAQPVVGGQHQRSRRAVLPLPVHQPGAVPPRRPATAARRVAWLARSPHRHEVQIAGFAPLAAFLEEVGLMGRIARRMWRRSHFL